jgi:5-methylcytosine-specific restriction enzyme subunit McrC
MKAKFIQTYEWAKLNVGIDGFSKNHLGALLKLNELHGFNYLDATSKGVSFRNYVGIIQVDDLTIEILPKADSGGQNTDWRDLLLHMLIQAKKIRVYEKGEAHVGKRSMHLLDIYMHMFLDELSYLLKRGLIKSYRTQTTNSLALKGKLELATHLSKNIVHKERFYTTHQVYDHNILIHQIILFALNIVRHFSATSEIAAKANRISLLLPQIEERQITLEDFKSLHINRKTRSYNKITELSKVIIGNYSPSISKGRNKMLALLFNMDHLWEQYLFQSLRKKQHELGYEIYRETKRLFTSESYNLNPDILLRKGEKTYVLDAKWKQPKRSKGSQQDLRQIYTYCRYWKARHGFLIYPGRQSQENKRMTYDDGQYEYNCTLVFLPIAAIRNITLDHILEGPLKEGKVTLPILPYHFES